MFTQFCKRFTFQYHDVCVRVRAGNIVAGNGERFIICWGSRPMEINMGRHL